MQSTQGCSNQWPGRHSSPGHQQPAGVLSCSQTIYIYIRSTYQTMVVSSVQVAKAFTHLRSCCATEALHRRDVMLQPEPPSIPNRTHPNSTSDAATPRTARLALGRPRGGSNVASSASEGGQVQSSDWMDLRTATKDAAEGSHVGGSFKS